MQVPASSTFAQNALPAPRMIRFRPTRREENAHTFGGQSLSCVHIRYRAKLHLRYRGK
jgi:hypothetical protein